MYGRADGMPSFQLTVAVYARFAIFKTYVLHSYGRIANL
jgi:hypothetical protein